MAIDTVISSIKLDTGADDGKIPVYNSTSKSFDMVPGGGPWSTWTPTVSGTSGAVTSYSEQIGRYVVIGKTVHFTCRVRVSNKGTLAGPIRLHIPHTMVDVGFEIPFASSYIGYPSNNFFTGMKGYGIHAGANNYIQFQILFGGALIQRSAFSNNDFIAVSGTYEIA